MRTKGKQDAFFNVYAMLLCCMGLSAILLIAMAFLNLTVFFIALPFVLCYDVISIIAMMQNKNEQRQFLQTLAKELGQENRELLYRFPLPVTVCQKDGRILWYNDHFHDQVAQREPLTGENFSKISTENLEDFCNRTGVQITYKGNCFHVYAVFSPHTDSYLFYFEQNTSLIQTAQEYKVSRPVILLMMIDNYEELFEDRKESEKSSILSAIDENIEDFIGETTGFVKRLTRDRFMAVVEQRHLDACIQKRFDILDRVRKISKDGRVPVTLSIGVGFDGQTLLENEAFARQALDMALGRGGDQAAVKTVGGFQFYGGVSKGVEKRTKVKSRIIATAMHEFICQSDKVILMGHRFGDLDCIGTSIGMRRAVSALGKPCYIAIDRQKNLGATLLACMDQAGLNDAILHPDDAIALVTPKTLLIVVDTHNPDFVESKELYECCENVIVIDHHRKMVNYIDRALIFYHEPYASSTSEMATELIPYLGECKLEPFEAEALMAGIMLDTKNFVIKTGVRTFEAAAYLKELGADTVVVRRLFSNSIDSYQKKSRIVSAAETYRNCAIAIADLQSEDMRTVAPQAADELLNISDVYASFVIYKTDTIANISARSLGDINAQVVMESLGGGGHQTMAACQLPDTDLEKARQLLLEAIDHYLNDYSPDQNQEAAKEEKGNE